MQAYQLLLSARTTWDLALTGQLAQHAGYDGLEVVMGGLLREVPLERYDIPLPIPVVAIHAPYGGDNLAVFQASLADGIAVAEALGARVVNIHPPSQELVNGDSSHVAGAIEHLKEMQGRYSTLTLCYEVMGKPHFGEVPFLPEAWLMQVQRYKPNATLNTTHLAYFGIEPGSYVSPLGTQLNHVHLSDYNPETGEDHRWPGEGVIDWPKFFEALKQSPTELVTLTLEPSGKNHLQQSTDKIIASAKLIRKLLH